MRNYSSFFFAQRIRILFIPLVLVFLQGYGQNKNELDILNEKSSSRHLKEFKGLSPRRGYDLSYNPAKFMGNTFLWMYQSLFSEQIMANCGFEPSCSSFARKALKERGVIVGIILTADRLTRCNGREQLESEAYLVNTKTGKLRDEPDMYKFGK